MQNKILEENKRSGNANKMKSITNIKILNYKVPIHLKDEYILVEKEESTDTACEAEFTDLNG